MTRNSGIRATRITALLALAERVPPPATLVHRVPPYIEMSLASDLGPHEFELDEVAWLAANLPNLTVWIAPGEKIGFWEGRLWRRQPQNRVTKATEALLVRLGCARAPEEPLGFLPTPQPLPPLGLAQAVRGAGGDLALDDGTVIVVGDEVVQAIAAAHPLAEHLTYSYRR